MLDRPLVSVVLLNWNGGSQIVKCVAHVLAQVYEPIELIVVDNGSTDDSLNCLKTHFGGITFIENGSNVGYARGMNRGIAEAHGTFVIPLNQDACLEKNFVSECVKRILLDDLIGVIGGRVLSWVGDELTDIRRKGEGEHSLMRKRFQGDGGNFSSEPILTFAPAGCFPFLRRSMLEDVRHVSGYYFDEAYGTGWEDCDLYFRMHLRGWKCLFLPTAQGWHVGSGSVGGKATFFGKSTEYQARILRNRYFTIIKNLPPLFLAWLSPYLLLTEAAIPFYFLARSPRSLWALVTAWRQVAGSLPSLFQKRTHIQASRTVHQMHLKQYFVHL